MTERVHTSADVAALATRILAPRQRPLVVVSTDPRTDAVVLDQTELEHDLRDIADLVLIPTGDLTRELDSLLPDKTQVYGGAGRSYPIDFGSDPDWRRSPLRFPSTRATEQLIGDVHSHAAAAGLFDKPSARRVAASGVVKGFIGDARALVDVDGRGLATISRELTYPPIPLEWTLHKGQRVTGTLDLDTKLLLVEQPAPTTDDLARAFPHRCVTLALVRKVSSARAALLLHPAVEFVLRSRDVSPNPLDTVDLLVAEGDVVAARVSHLSDGTLHVSLTDVDDDEPIVESLALTAGGRPWLVEDRALETKTKDAAGDLAAFDQAAAASVWEGTPGGADAAATTPAATGEEPSGEDVRGGTTAASVPIVAVPEPARPRPGPGPRKVEPAPEPVARASEPEPEPAAPATPGNGTALQSTQLQLAAERAKNDELRRLLAEAGADDSSIAKLRARASGAEARVREELAERGELERQLLELKEQRRLSTQAMRDARRATPAAKAESRDDRRRRWATDAEWIRHEVYLAWVERVEPTERTTWALGAFTPGPEFAASLVPLDDGQFDKAMKAVVDAATGRIREVPGRKLHPLREGDGATAADVVRADGAKCWRAYIEQNTPAARRLHYWVLPGGGIEFSRVVTHDDMRP